MSLTVTKYIRWELVALTLTLVVSFATGGEGDELPVIQANREIGLGFSAAWLYYRETNASDSILDSEHGWTPGFALKGSAITDMFGAERIFGSVSYHFNTGYTHHNSVPLVGPGNINYGAGFTTNDVIGELGKGFLLWQNLLITPVVELQYREWQRALPQAGLAVQEDYRFFAPGVALRGTYAITPALVSTTKLGVEYTISPTVATIGNAANGIPGPTLALGSRPVWQADFNLDYALTQDIHTYIDAAYSHFSFGQSSVFHFATLLSHFTNEVEPNSTTDTVNVDLGIAWSF